MICQTNYFISASSPKLRIFKAACAACVYEDILWIQSKAQHCGCISPSFAIHVLLLGNILTVVFFVFNSVRCISPYAISTAGTSDCSDV